MMGLTCDKESRILTPRIFKIFKIVDRQMGKAVSVCSAMWCSKQSHSGVHRAPHHNPVTWVSSAAQYTGVGAAATKSHKSSMGRGTDHSTRGTSSLQGPKTWLIDAGVIFPDQKSPTACCAPPRPPRHPPDTSAMPALRVRSLNRP